jgi:hypothetical protein
MDIEVQVLEVIRQLEEFSEGRGVSIKEITERLIERHGEDFGRKITPHWVGHIIRRKLGLRTERRDSNYVIHAAEGPKLKRLFDRYGLSPTPQADSTDFTDFSSGTSGSRDSEKPASYLRDESSPEALFNLDQSP